LDLELERKSMDTLKNIDAFSYTLEKIFPEAQDFLPLNGTDYVELYVGNAKQAAHFYKTAFGFQSLAYSGLETGVKDKCSYVVVQDKIRLVLTTPFDPESEITKHIAKHGDGVRVIALWVDEVRGCILEFIVFKFMVNFLFFHENPLPNLIDCIEFFTGYYFSDIDFHNHQYKINKDAGLSNRNIHSLSHIDF